MASNANFPLVDLSKSLLIAARRGNETEVRTLLTQGASFTSDWLGSSPLHYAAQYGHLDTALLLMRAGMSWDAKTKVNKTPLHLATQYGHMNLVSAFIMHGANVNAKDMLFMTPLHWAAQTNNVDIAELLLENGAEIEIKNKFDKSPIDICIDNNYEDILAKMKRRKEMSDDIINAENINAMEGDSNDTVTSEKPADIISPNILSGLTALAGIPDSSSASVVTLDDLTQLQSSFLNYPGVSLENIRSIVLTDAGRLALQFLNKGLENSLFQSCDRSNNDGKNAAEKNTSHFDQNPEQYLNKTSRSVDSDSENKKPSKAKEPFAVTDFFPSTSSCISLPPVFPECNLRNAVESSDNFVLNLETDLLQKQIESNRHSVDLSKNLTLGVASGSVTLTGNIGKKL